MEPPFCKILNDKIITIKKLMGELDVELSKNLKTYSRERIKSIKSQLESALSRKIKFFEKDIVLQDAKFIWELANSFSEFTTKRESDWFVVKDKIEIFKLIIESDYIKIDDDGFIIGVFFSGSGVKNAGFLPELPEKLIALRWAGSNIETIPKLPAGLKKLKIEDNKSLKQLPELPEGLEELNCNHLNLDNLPKLPESLIKLSCGYNPIVKIDNVPSNLKELNCSNCPKLQSIGRLPDSIKKVYISECNDLKDLPDLPFGLEWLDASCSGLSEDKRPFREKIIKKALQHPNGKKFNLTTFWGRPPF